MKKKTVNFLKTKNFLKKYPIIIFLQHNNLTVDNWSQLRTASDGTKIGGIFVFKNTIMETILLNEFFKVNTEKSKKIEFLFQGPSVAIGCKSFIELKNIYNSLKSIQNVFIIGAIYSNMILNHLDLEKLVTLDDTFYIEFFNVFRNKNNFYTTLQQSINIDFLSNSTLNLYSCLLSLKQKLKHVYLYIVNKRSQSNRRFPYGYLVTTSLQLLIISSACCFIFFL